MHTPRRISPYLLYPIACATLLGIWLFLSLSKNGNTGVANLELPTSVDGQPNTDKYGVIGSIQYWREGKFVTHELDSMPQLDIHHPPDRDIPINDLGYTAVVLYLVSESRLRETVLSLSYLFNNVPMNPWPILLFHAEDMDDPRGRVAFLLQLFDYLGKGQQALTFVKRIEFIRIQLSLPPGVSTDINVVKPVFEGPWPGYHMMCNFFSTQIFDHPRLQNITYYLRLDTDSYIFKPICFDPFEIFHRRNRTYGYRSRSQDPPFVTVGMWPFTDQYAKRHPEVENQMARNGWWWPPERGRDEKKINSRDYPLYYNNFEIVKLEAFRRPDVKDWLRELESVPERFYKYRWGDAPIRFATVNMFFNVKRDVEEFCAIPYWHNGRQGNQCSCEAQKAGRDGH